MPQAYLPGKSMVSAGVGNYGGESALAFGLSKLSDNGLTVNGQTFKATVAKAPDKPTSASKNTPALTIVAECR